MKPYSTNASKCTWKHLLQTLNKLVSAGNSSRGERLSWFTAAAWQYHCDAVTRKTSVIKRHTIKHISVDATIEDTGKTWAEILHISGDLSFTRDKLKVELRTIYVHLKTVTMPELCCITKQQTQFYVLFLEYTIDTQKDYEDEWRASLTGGVLNEFGFFSLVKWRNPISIDIRKAELQKQKPV